MSSAIFGTIQLIPLVLPPACGESCIPLQIASIQHFELDDSYDPGLLHKKPPPFKKLRRSVFFSCDERHKELWGMLWTTERMLPLPTADTGQKIKNRMTKDDFTHCSCHLVHHALSGSFSRSRSRPVLQQHQPLASRAKEDGSDRAPAKPSLCGEDCINRYVVSERKWTAL